VLEANGETILFILGVFVSRYCALRLVAGLCLGVELSRSQPHPALEIARLLPETRFLEENGFLCHAPHLPFEIARVLCYNAGDLAQNQVQSFISISRREK
jgi:hypothetical protein